MAKAHTIATPTDRPDLVRRKSLPPTIPSAAVTVAPDFTPPVLMAPMIVIVRAGHDERRRSDELASIGRRNHRDAGNANNSDTCQEKYLIEPSPCVA
jgi:hypothetical protein